MTIIMYTHPIMKTVYRQYKSDTTHGHIATNKKMREAGYTPTQIRIPNEVLNFLENYHKKEN